MTDFIKFLFDIFKVASPLRKYELILTAGLATAGTIAIFLVGKDKLLLFLSEFKGPISITSTQTLSFILFIVTVIVAFFWIASVLLEISWIERYYENLMPPPQNGTIVIATLVGGFLFVLAYISENILNYSFCYLIFAFINLLSDIISSTTLEKALASYKKSGHSVSEDLINEIQLYYLQRPKKLLGLFRVIITIAAIGFSLWGQMDQVPYFLMIVLLIGNEIFHWSWRIRLYRQHGFVFV